MRGIADCVREHFAERIAPLIRVCHGGGQYLAVGGEDISPHCLCRHDVLALCIVGIVDDLRTVIVDIVYQISADRGK